MMHYSDDTEKRILFICMNKPELSFWLDLSGQCLIMLEINDLFELGCQEFTEKSDYFQIDRSGLYNQNGKNFQDKLEREYLNSEFEFKPVIRFNAVEKMISLNILDESKEIPNEFTLSVSPMSTNRELLELIKKKIGVQASAFINVKNETIKRIIYNNNNTLATSFVQNNNKLNVYISDKEPKEDLRKGIPENFEIGSAKAFVDISNINDVSKVSFSKTAPEYRIVHSGLNIEGKCKNKSCPYNGLPQISPQGIGYTEIIGRLYNDIYCVHKDCKNKLEIVTCGFYNCYYNWKGYKSVGGELQKVVEQKYQLAESERYTRYNPKKNDGSSNLVQWVKLWISVEPIKSVCQICCNPLKTAEAISFKTCDNQNVHQVHKQCINDQTKLKGLGVDQCFVCLHHQT